MARLIWLMGASGSGKDSLLLALRECAPDRVVVAHRYITRSASAGGENHVALSEQEFLRRREFGLFALEWQAHQFYYALGTEIDLWLDSGLDVLVNGSRRHLAIAQQRYGERLLPVCLQVTPSVLASRLQQRGREDRAEIARRMLRAAEPIAPGCLTLNNDGALEQTLRDFQRLIGQ